MPIYEYRCNHCGHELEAIQKISEAPLTDCPACATDGLRKRISATVFRLKGKGWYETDFKSDRKRNVAGDDDGAPKEDSAAKEKENGKDKTQPEGKGPLGRGAREGASRTQTDSGSEKSSRNEKSDSKTGDRSRGDAKTSASGASSTS